MLVRGGGKNEESCLGENVILFENYVRLGDVRELKKFQNVFRSIKKQFFTLRLRNIRNDSIDLGFSRKYPEIFGKDM